MTTLEQRIAEAMYRAWPKPPIIGSESLNVNDVLADLARAVVAVLPTADVSDLAIAEATAYAESGGYEHGQRIVAVRALLDAQAAAHAAETADLRSQMSAAVEVYDQLQTISGGYKAERDAAEAKVETLRAEVERLVIEAEREASDTDESGPFWRHEPHVKASALRELIEQRFGGFPLIPTTKESNA